ncbi:MAG: hypothetical protein QOK05_1027 [Chloroflexota bacterium]|jgi:hypothetical protein|nr:hypothetical protein [Chloroflexota bacterium]
MEQEVPTPDVPTGQVQVQIPDHRFEVLYSDQAFVSHSPVGFTIDFAQLTPQLAVSRVVARVGMSATHLKLLVRVLSENLQHYEEHYGPVAITPEMVEQHAQPTHHIGFQPSPQRREGEAGHPAAPGGPPQAGS